MKRSSLVIAFALTLAITADAFAAGALNGKTYAGRTPSSGVNHEGFHTKLTVVGIKLVVSHDGRSVTVRFTSPQPLIYCQTSETVFKQSGKAARISGGGSFSATVGIRFAAGANTPGPPPVTEVVSGRFSGHSVRGTIHTNAAECSGSTSFSATAH
jgi:hypothetical protein